MRVNTTDLAECFQQVSCSGGDGRLVDPAKKNIIHYSFSEERDIKDMLTVTAGDTISSAVFEGLDIPLKDIFS